MAIGMAKVHFADVPWHVGGRKCNLQPGGDAVLVHLVYIVDPDGHPHSLIALFVPVLLKRCSVRAAATASLRSLTKKDASLLTGSDCTKGGRRTPVLQFLPSPPFKPRELPSHVGYVQDRSQSFGFHSGSRITPGPTEGFG